MLKCLMSCLVSSVLARQTLQDALWIDLALRCCPESAIVCPTMRLIHPTTQFHFSAQMRLGVSKGNEVSVKNNLVRHNVPHTYLKYVNVI